MSRLLGLLRREPVRAYLLAVVLAGVGLLTAFGVDLSTAQVTALSGFAGVVLAAGDLAVRGKVVPLAKLEGTGRHRGDAEEEAA